jgi:effector-binding domain-containing protein
MKILRFLLILLLLIVVVVVVLGLVAPKEIATERSVIINAPQSVVANHMFHFSNFKTWSPWQEMDPNMKTEITGDDGQVGSVYSWVGKKEVGSGNMKVVSRTNEELVIDLNFTEPFEKSSKGVWKAIDNGNNQTKAVWGFSTHYGFPMNGLMMVMGMTKMLEKDFDKGLNKLKAYVESGKAESAPAAGAHFDIKETQFAGGNYAGIRKTVAFADMDKFFSSSYEALGKAAGARINGKGVGIYYKWDEKAGKTDVAAAFAITGSEPVAGAKIITIPAATAYMVEYKGGYSGSMAAHQALMSEVTAKGKTQDIVVEEYVVNPGDTKDSNSYVTKIYYLVK